MEGLTAVRAILCVVGGAYAGALAIGAIIRVVVIGPPLDLANLFSGAVGLLVFTIPGALIVLGVFAHLRGSGASPLVSRSVAITAGTAIGGETLLYILRDPAAMALGAVAGLLLGGCCLLLDAVLFGTRRTAR